jgi:prepilin-type N-terminal cleavage/methylation domain-containing protein
MKSLFRKIVKFWQRAILRSPKRSTIKGDRRKHLAFGFTLIELLVASLIASALVSVLLGFLLGVLDSDRRETAKSNAQEELQAAIGFISNDLQEAIYIYGADALASINEQLPHRQTSAAACNPTTNTCTPILVFWKRYNYDPNTEENYTAIPAPAAKQYIGCMPYEDGNATILTNCRTSAATGAAFGRDTYTYSLVAYYLKNDVGLNSTVWSNTARILRWEIKDGYVAYCATGGAITKSATGTAVSPANCPATTRLSTRADSTAPALPVASRVDPNVYFILPDQGFTRPDFASAGTLSSLAGGWRKYANFNLSNDQFVTLVDLMDDTAYNVNQGGDNLANAASTATTASFIKIPIGRNVPVAGLPTTNPNCDDPSVGVGNTNPATTTNLSGTVTQRVPADFSDATTNPSRLTSFYACVAPENVTVRLFMRGNAIARLATPVLERTARPPTANNLSFFPTADVRAFGRSAVGLKTR